jgi:uroporphyrinogen decarboxylase
MSPEWESFVSAARRQESDTVPTALIVDSPWLPGYAGIDTRDYYLFPEKWLQLNLQLLERFPGMLWLPGFWVEYGMAAEPSAFGAKFRFYPDHPPSIMPISEDLAYFENLSPANPQEDGLMSLVLRLYQEMDARLHSQGLAIRMVAARGPVTVASWLAGISPLLTGFAENPIRVTKLLETVSTTLIAWLHAQLDSLRRPEGILLLDDVVGMVSKRHYESLVQPHLQRIFNEFDGLIRIYHNDTPCMHLAASLAETNFDVFNFSHKMDIGEVKARMGHRVALMGNVPPLEVGVHGSPEEVESWARACLEKAAPGGGLILSYGGGLSPGTPPENIDAMLEAAKKWNQIGSKMAK